MIDDKRLRPPRNGETRTLDDGTRQVFRYGAWCKIKVKSSKTY